MYNPITFPFIPQLVFAEALLSEILQLLYMKADEYTHCSYTTPRHIVP